MKKHLATTLGFIFLAFTGCDTQEAGIGTVFSDSYELTEDVEFDHHWASVRRLKIVGEGAHSITISGVGTGGGGVVLSPNGEPATEIMMTFTVDPGRRIATWWITNYSVDPEGGTSGRAGSPQSFKYSDNSKYLTDLVEFPDVEGRHELGEKVPLVRFLDRASGETEIVLVIE